jgi:hypothetical protein
MYILTKSPSKLGDIEEGGKGSKRNLKKTASVMKSMAILEVHIYVYIHICVYLCIKICVYISIFTVYIYTYIYIHTCMD